ncbi:MAG: methyltransferase [Leptolyngbyaceae cyanobacterium RM2_2_4]|nr:methyltransferase [Leptolyngbyaceae cyanobacterium RM2_2_4]
MGYIVSALRQMGWDFQLHHRFSTEELMQQCRVETQHQALLGRLLQILAEVGTLTDAGDRQWQVGQVPAVEDPLELWRSLHNHYPAHHAELDLLGRCGQSLAEVLQGHCDPLQILFPNGSFALVEQLYQHSPAAQAMNQLVQQAIATALENLPTDRTIRILELGAGTGGTTASVLPHLPNQQTDYVFTDISPLFLAKAQQKFGDYPFVRYQILDVEQPQQALFQHFDLILAANVLHATADLRQSLTHVQQMLAPGGWLVLLEGVQPQRWLDLIFGLTEGWWKFRDNDLRPLHPLLRQAQWRNLLQEQFAAVDVITAVEDETIAQQAMILAQSPDATAGTSATDPGNWLIFADRTGVGQQLASQLQEQGDRCTVVYAASSDQGLQEEALPINPEQPEAFQRLFQRVTTAPTYRGVIYLWGLESATTDMTLDALEAASRLTAEAPLHLLKALETAAIAPPMPLWLVTRGAQAVTPDQPLAIAQSMLWGLGRVLAVEQPLHWGGLIDLDPETSVVQAATDLVQTLRAGSAAEPLAVRQGQWYAARWCVRRSRHNLHHPTSGDRRIAI